MEFLIKDLTEYVERTLGIKLTPKLWKEDKALPFFLQNLYVFYSVSLLGKTCLLVVARESDAIAPKILCKHFKELEDKTKVPCIYVDISISCYHRKRLIEHRIQFIAPNQQIYLPGLGVDWLENHKIYQKHSLKDKKITPSTQAVLLYVLLHHDNHSFIPLELAKALHYTPMTMTRALNELESFHLGQISRNGKERRIHFSRDLAALWKQAESLMLSPVKNRFWLKSSQLKEIKSLAILAGLSALEKSSMLTAPKLSTYAVGIQTWKFIKQSYKIEKLPFSEDADIELEIWSYDPALFGQDHLADPFSLYLSLRENKDERIEAALEHLMEKIKW